MKKDQVLEKLKSAQTEIEEIRKIKKPIYATKDIYVPGIGCVNELSSLQELVKAHATISKARTDLTESAMELEIELSAEEFEFNGIKIGEWVADIKNRKDEILTNKRLKNLKNAKAVLEKHLSDDDKFTLEMEEISDILDTI